MEHRTIAIPIKNIGTQPLNYHVTIPPEYFAAWRSDEPGGPTYSWVDLPSSAATIKLGNDAYTDTIPLKLDFPFFSYSFTETLVTSNGMLAFDRPLSTDQEVSSCLPDDRIYFYLIAPFRTDLDPSRGGQIRYGTLADRRTFVLSYENIPLHNGPLAATYTFQVLLHSRWPDRVSV